jgi:osmotically-inducible protein OsmY
LLAAAALAAGLSACAPLVVGGAVVGTMMAVDRRTTGTQVEDEGIELRAANRIRELLGDRAHVNVTSFNRQVLLTGEVPTAQDRHGSSRSCWG